MTNIIDQNVWDERHGKILMSILGKFKNNDIKYFIIRNFEGLPNNNTSKDVDIIVEPTKIKESIDLLKSAYKEFGLEYYYYVKFGHGHLCYGMDIDTSMAIHIDLMAGYYARGYELFSFEELYVQTEVYNNIRILNEFYTGLMVFIYKQFGLKRPFLKQEYREIIYMTHKKYPQFKNMISKFAGEELTLEIFTAIEEQKFDKMLTYSKRLSYALSVYAFKNNPIQTIINTFKFYQDKITRIVFQYNKFSKVFSVMAPDGAGKTTFINTLIGKLLFYYVEDKDSNRFHIYHFRPRLLPNIGALGKKTGIHQPDEDFENPHRSKPVSTLSSLFRMSYYWLDYVIGYNYYIRKDVQFDRFSVFDRYSFDLIVDPGRTRLNLPLWIRKLYVKCMPHPKINFYLDAEPEVIYKRKQELTLDEITRQVSEYRKISKHNKYFVILDANKSVDKSVDKALKIILDIYAERL